MKIFIGGSTGATGRDLIELGRGQAELVVHVRPQSLDKYRTQQPDGPEPAVFDLADANALDAAMAGCDAVISTIGTMRKRFHTGDTYRSSDIDTTRQLVEAAERCDVSHFVLMGAYGASWVPGPYYDAKRDAEALVMNGSIPWTITRPSALLGNGRGPGFLARTGWLEGLPGVRGAVLDMKGIPTRVCAAAMLKLVLDASHHRTVLNGRDLWALGTTSV